MTRDEKGRTYEHNLPKAHLIWGIIVRAGFLKHTPTLPVPSTGSNRTHAWHEWNHSRATSESIKAVDAWLADPSGAVPVPVRTKKVFDASTRVPQGIVDRTPAGYWKNLGAVVSEWPSLPESKNAEAEPLF